MLVIQDASRIPRPALHDIPVPRVAPWRRPGRPSRWRPVNHGALADGVVEALGGLGLEVIAEAWTVNPSRTALFGCVDVLARTGLRLPPGVGLSVALRHSNVGRYAVSFAFGGRVVVCDNGLLVGELVEKRKHTDGLDVSRTIREGIAAFADSGPDVCGFVGGLRGYRLSEADADRILVAMGRRAVLPWSAVGRAEAAWRRPTHRAFRPRNAWSLYNAATEAAKRRSPAGQIETLRRLRRLFDRRALDGCLGRS